MTKQLQDCTIREVVQLCKNRSHECCACRDDFLFGDYKELKDCPFLIACDIFKGYPAFINKDLLEQEVTLSDTYESAET